MPPPSFISSRSTNGGVNQQQKLSRRSQTGKNLIKEGCVYLPGSALAAPANNGYYLSISAQ